jgi:ubiquinone/menaquinone biosynthesis C-methylase UbiE
MIYKDLDWWKIEGINSETPAKREPYFKAFIDRILKTTGVNVVNEFDKSEKKIAEIAGGPFGGILEMSFKNCNNLTQIDLLADKFKDLNWTKTKMNWLTSPAEQILAEDDKFDFLIGFNSIDHGWDIEASISECIRVSKSGALSFDTNRYKNPGYPDRSHYQIVDYDKVCKYISSINCIKNSWSWIHGISNGHVNVLEFYWNK